MNSPLDWNAKTIAEFRANEGRPSAARSEEAAKDLLRMARFLLAGKAVAGIVNAVDGDHREVMTTNRAPDERRAGL